MLNIDINNEAVKILAKSISTAVNTAVEDIKYDKTYDGIVNRLIRDNLYSVDFNGATYTIPLSVKNIILSNGDTVKITIPQNNWNNMYISNAVGSLSTEEGFNTNATGTYSHAEGQATTANNMSAHAEGQLTTASGSTSHAEGNSTTASNMSSHSEGQSTIASGTFSHAEGVTTSAIGDYSHAEGNGTVSNGNGCHAEGVNTLAHGYISHAEGYYSTANGNYSHSEGGGTDSTKITLASGDYSHAEGNHTTASGKSSHSEGSESSATAFASHAEGQYCAAYKDQAHAEGYSSHANGYWSHAEGNSTTNGKSSHSEGSGTIAGGDYSHVEGIGTNSNGYESHVIGQYNKVLTGNSTTYSATADAFVIGDGTGSSALSNAFRVTFDGRTYGRSAFNSTGADYSEYFEWLDGNLNNEDRVGKFVTLKGDKIKFANDGDYILGVTSSTPAIIGDSASESWNKRYITDIFGRIQYHEVLVPSEIATITNEDNILEEVVIRESHTELQPIYNLNYDYTKENEYVDRGNRQEWSTVGMIGKLIIIDDGTCDVDGFCKPKDGIATKSDDGYRVMTRLDSTHIRILIK